MGVVVLSRCVGLAGLAALFGLASCAAIDQYSSRAITYNLQAEQVQQQGLLLNIVRASLRRPMQFTGLQTINGAASISGSINGAGSRTNNSPFIFPPGSTVLSKIAAASVGGSASVGGTDTFTVPVLDTKEFYQGLLTPISGQLLDLYLQAGYPHDVLFNLTIERIIIKRSDGKCRPEVHTPDCEMSIRNYVPRDTELELFQSLIGYFIRLGLATEPVIETSAKKTKKKEAPSKEADSPSVFKPFVFCFAPLDASVYRYFNREVLCGHPGTAQQMYASEVGRKSVVTGVPMFKEYVDRVYREIILPKLDMEVGAGGYRAFREFAGKKVSVSFGTRSIEEILYYLGEIVRRASHPPEGVAPRTVQVRTGPPQNPFPVDICPFTKPDINGYSCVNAFIVQEGAFDANGISVDYEGVHYSLSADATNSWSMPILDIVKQLLAVNTSAKELPASNVISVISQ